MTSIGWADETLDRSVLKNWLKVDEEFTIGKMLMITLVGGESAYLTTAVFPQRGRCCEEVTVLARPERKEAREIDVLSQTLRVLDLEGDGVSEIEGRGSHIGQGWLEGRWQIYRMNEWEPFVLYDYGPIVLSNEGAGCGLREHDLYNRVCEQRTVTLNYEDLNQDGVLDLIQTVIKETFWFKNGTDEDIIFADESTRQSAIDLESHTMQTTCDEFLYARNQFIKQP